MSGVDTEFRRVAGAPVPGAPMIQMVDVCKTLGGRQILSGVNLEVFPGETLVVIGRSGTGKSVSLRMLIGLMRPDTGRIILQGRDVTELHERDYATVRRLFGVLFQSGALINWLTVAENVALPLREHSTKTEAEIQRIVDEKLTMLELLHARNLHPSEISGGMKKRAGLARALVLDPRIILYDEPTSGLDPVMSSQINELVRRLQHELHVTSIMVTHDMESAYSVADRIAMLYQGKIIFVGTPDEVRRTDNPVVRQFVVGALEGPITGDLRKEEGLTAGKPTPAQPPPAVGHAPLPRRPVASAPAAPAPIPAPGAPAVAPAAASAPLPSPPPKEEATPSLRPRTGRWKAPGAGGPPVPAPPQPPEPGIGDAPTVPMAAIGRLPGGRQARMSDELSDAATLHFQVPPALGEEPDPETPGGPPPASWGIRMPAGTEDIKEWAVAPGAPASSAAPAAPPSSGPAAPPANSPTPDEPPAAPGPRPPVGGTRMIADWLTVPGGDLPPGATEPGARAIHRCVVPGCRKAAREGPRNPPPVCCGKPMVPL